MQISGLLSQLFLVEKKVIMSSRKSRASGSGSAPQTPRELKELKALPILLGQLELDVPRRERTEAIERLARLVDSVDGAAAVHLGTVMRGDWDGDGGEGDGLELVMTMLHDEDPMVVQHSLLILGNLCSKQVDPNADDTKVLLRGKKVIETLLPLLTDERAGARCADADARHPTPRLAPLPPAPHSRRSSRSRSRLGRARRSYARPPPALRRACTLPRGARARRHDAAVQRCGAAEPEQRPAGEALLELHMGVASS